MYRLLLIYMISAIGASELLAQGKRIRTGHTLIFSREEKKKNPCG